MKKKQKNKKPSSDEMEKIEHQDWLDDLKKKEEIKNFLKIKGINP
jgi:hypothetical protein